MLHRMDGSDICPFCICQTIVVPGSGVGTPWKLIYMSAVDEGIDGIHYDGCTNSTCISRQFPGQVYSSPRELPSPKVFVAVLFDLCPSPHARILFPCQQSFAWKLVEMPPLLETERPLDIYATTLPPEFPSPVTRSASQKSHVYPSDNESWAAQTEIFEYTSAANPRMAPVPVLGLKSSEHRSGATRVVNLDLSKELEIDGYPATSPNLLASFLRICEGEELTTGSCATSQIFFVIHGRGTTRSPLGEVKWSSGDLFVIPAAGEEGTCAHTCEDDAEEMTGGAGLYWISDSPLLAYLGVVPKVKKFEPSFFSREALLSNVEAVRHDPQSAHRNRLGILLGNKATPQTKTLTHTLWALLNVLPPGNVQKPHRHNSVALDLAVYAGAGTYTLMGKELDAKGDIVDPIKAVWETGAMFVTPPGWWHSHHNESTEDAYVLPVQDAGLYTHQRTLDIRFAEEEVRLHREGLIR